MIRLSISQVRVRIASGLTLFSFSSVLSQNQFWPTDAGRVLSATFAEYRPGHLHAGIDIKTWGRSGYRCFAVDSGFVWRIRTSPFGYGKAVYFRLHDGRTCVYAHLLKFSHVLDSLLWKEQSRTGRYETDLWPEPGSLKFGKGDILGFTGSSGATDPHLHFEVRDAMNRPFDPLAMGFPVEDAALPVLESLLVSPLTSGSSVNGDFVPFEYGLLAAGPGTYQLRDTVQVWGTIGFSVCGYDPMDGASNRNGAKAMRLFIGDSLVFESQYGWFDYAASGQSVLEWDYRILRMSEKPFRELYIRPGNELPFYSRPAGRNGTVRACDTGFDFPEDPFSPEAMRIGRGNWTFLAEVSDYFGNCSRISGVMRAWPPGETDGRSVRPAMKRNGISRSLSGGLKTRFFDDYLYFRWTPDTGRVLGVSLGLGTAGSSGSVMPLTRHSGGWWFCAVPLKGLEQQRLDAMLEVRFDNGTLRREVRTIRPEAAHPGRPMLLRSEDNRCRIFFDRNALYRPAWGQVLADTLQIPGTGAVAGYRLEYNDVPLKNPAEVFMDTGGDAGETDRIAVYSCEEGGALVFRGDQKLGNWIRADVMSLGFFALLRDTVPPSLGGIKPASGSEVATRKPMISAVFGDDLSGIRDEEQYRFLLDGSRLVVEYDPENSRGFHRPREPLGEGRHELEFIIRDRAGNETRRRSVFFVKTRP